MEFEHINKNLYLSGYIDFPEKFNKFIKKFDIDGFHLSQPTTISASYLLRLLQNGSSTRARGYGKRYRKDNDECSNQIYSFFKELLDNCALWKSTNGKVLCTAMPYGSKKKITNSFLEMTKLFNYPETITMIFLDDYKFRHNGDHMILIYCDL